MLKFLKIQSVRALAKPVTLMSFSSPVPEAIRKVPHWIGRLRKNIATSYTESK
jgi:hypothetical protein